MNDDQLPGGALDRGAEELVKRAEATADARQGIRATPDGDPVLGSRSSADGETAPLDKVNSCSTDDTRAERSKSRKAVAQANFAAGLEAWRSQTSPAVGGPESSPDEASVRSGDPIGGAPKVGASTDANAEVAKPERQGESSNGSSISSKARSCADAVDVQADEPVSSNSSHPWLVVLVSDKVVEGGFENANGVIVTLAKIAELDDPVLEVAAPLIRDIVAAVLGTESARVGLECQTLIYLESGRVGREWVMRVDPEFAGRLGDTSTTIYLNRFFDYVKDRDIWSPKVDAIVELGGIEARLISVARALRQARIASRQLGSAARLICTEWRSPVELPMNIGEGRPPSRDTKKDEVVGHVTCDDWGERILSVRPFGKKAKVPVSYVQAEGAGDQAAMVQEAHRSRTQLYRAEFKATIVDGKVDHRTLISLKPVQADLQPDTQDP